MSDPFALIPLLSATFQEYDLVSKEEAKTRAATARDVYQAKKDEEERAKAGDLIGLHVNQ